jgi:hypothetical protein
MEFTGIKSLNILFTILLDSPSKEYFMYALLNIIAI